MRVVAPIRVNICAGQQADVPEERVGEGEVDVLAQEPGTGSVCGGATPSLAADLTSAAAVEFARCMNDCHTFELTHPTPAKGD